MSEREFGPLLAHYRAERGWSQARLAERAELDPSSVSRFEAGLRAPERETVITLAEALALPMAERDRLLATAGFRSDLWDDPLLVELAQLLADGALPSDAADELRTLVRIAVQYGRLRSRSRPRT